MIKTSDDFVKDFILEFGGNFEILNRIATKDDLKCFQAFNKYIKEKVEYRAKKEYRYRTELMEIVYDETDGEYGITCDRMKGNQKPAYIFSPEYSSCGKILTTLFQVYQDEFTVLPYGGIEKTIFRSGVQVKASTKTGRVLGKVLIEKDTCYVLCSYSPDSTKEMNIEKLELIPQSKICGCRTTVIHRFPYFACEDLSCVEIDPKDAPNFSYDSRERIKEWVLHIFNDTTIKNICANFDKERHKLDPALFISKVYENNFLMVEPDISTKISDKSVADFVSQCISSYYDYDVTARYITNVTGECIIIFSYNSDNYEDSEGFILMPEWNIDTRRGNFERKVTLLFKKAVTIIDKTLKHEEEQNELNG